MAREFHVTAEEFLAGVRRAYIDAYCGGDESKVKTESWHPTDIADNMVVIVESIKSYAEEIISNRKGQSPGWK